MVFAPSPKSPASTQMTGVRRMCGRMIFSQRAIASGLISIRGQ
jgi:hypothetical protein